MIQRTAAHSSAVATSPGSTPAANSLAMLVSVMSWISRTHLRQRVISRSFDDPFKLALMLKDIGIAMQLAKSADVPAPLSALGQELWRAAGRDAAPEASVSELARWVERMTGTEITAGAAR